MNSNTKIQILLDNTPFPGAGQEIGGYPVIESAVDLAGKNWAIYLKGKLTATQAKAAVSKLTTTYFPLPVQDEYSLVAFETKAMTHARTNPPGDVTVVRGHMYYARPNPISKGAFQEEMDDMLIDKPEKHFTKYTITNPEALHQRLWKGVSYAGEAYGWKKGNELWHRRASFIMPKIKINKALKGATMFYHTHPAKDEPSLTSADDIQFYLDLHFAWGIKSFYTVMKHKLDYFTITSKKGGKEKYLRMEEDAFIEVVDGMIGEGEKIAKEVRDGDDIKFQNRITKEMVDLFNKKFGSIAKISFRPKRKNPTSKLARKALSPLVALVNPRPNPPIKVKDEYVAKALEELKGLDYAHEHYGADEYGHTMYVYWWLKHHLAPTDRQPKGRLFKLNEYGMDSDLRKKLRAYLSQPIVGNYTYMDGVYLLALYHDIAKLREKGSKKPGWEIGADMFRKEIGPELNLPDKLTEDLAFLFDTDLGRKGITDELFATQAGDYYGISKLVHMADMVTHHPTMYTKKGGESYKQETMVQLVNQLRRFLDHEYVIQNPPPHAVFVKWVADYGISDLHMEELEELLGDFHQSVVPDDKGKTKQTQDKSSGGHLYFMRFNQELVPALSRSYNANLALSTSKLLINVGKPVPDDLAKKDANIIYTLVGERLKESYPEIVIDEVTTPSIVNPRHASKVQVICISGPSGGGKSTVLRYLDKNLPNSSTPPTYTTRPKRPTDGEDRKFVTKKEFKTMIEQGKFVEYEVHGNGHFYGRIFDDFIGKYAIIEVTLGGKKAYEKRFPNMFTVYLDPDPSYTEQERAKAIFRRGGLSKEEAKRRAKKAAQGVARSKKIDFDLRVTMMKGKYTEGARKILAEIPSTNPQEKLDVGITQEEQEESDRLIALDKERIAAEEAEEAAEAAEAAEANKLREERFVQTTLPIEEPEEDEEWDAEEAYRELHDDSPWANPTKKKCPLPPKKGIIVYGASWCGPCRMTKKYLDEQGKKYKYVDIEEVKDYFKTIGPLTNNYKYIPVIFIDGKFLEGGYTALIARKNPHHCPIEVEARRAASDPSFIHHEWYIEHHLDYVMAIAKAIVHSDEPEDQQLIHDMVWMHDYPKMLGDKDNFELVREFVSKHRSERYTDRLMNQLRWMEEIKSPDWSGRTTTIAAVMSTADALAHYHGPFFQIFHDENPDTPIAELKKKNKAKLKKDKLKLRAGPKRKALDSIKFKYRGRKVRIVGNEHIAELIARKNPKVIVKKDKYRSRFVDEDGNDVTSIPVSSVELKEGVGSAKFGKSLTKKEAHRDRSGEWLRVSVSAYKGKQPIFEVAPIKFFDFGEGPNLTFFRTTGRKYFKNLKVEGPVYPTILSQIEEEPHAVLIVQGRLKVKIGDKWVNSDNMFYAKPEIRDDITDWVGESKGRRFEVFEEGEIVSVDTITRQFTYRPYKGGMMAEFHHYNRTKRETTQIYNVHMSDEGDHYWLHEIQVAEAARRKGTMLRAIQHTVFNMPEFLPDYPDKKPIRTLARAVEGIPQEKLVEALLNSGFEVLEQDVDGGVLMEFKWYEETKENPAYPVKWQQNPYILLIEPWTETEVMIDEDLARLMQVMWGQGIMTTNSDQPGEQRWTINGKEFRKPKDGQISIKNQESLDKILAKLPEIEQIFTPTIVSQANDGYAVRIQHTRAYYDSLAANNIVFSHITDRPKQPRMEELWEAKYHMRFSKDGLNRLHEAFGIPPLYTFQNPPPRSKPFPWNKNRVRRSIFKTMKRAQATLVSWNKGNAIGSPAVFALRSMGKIPRASGKYELR